MDLSAKTVINWFHNHRMRSKQQNRDENGKRIPSNNIYIKQELDSNSLDCNTYSCQNSYSTDSQKSSPASTAPAASPDSTRQSPPLPTSASTTNTAATDKNQLPASAQLNSSRKRKNANPQYVSAGAVLDKHNNSDEVEEAEEAEIDVTGDMDTQSSFPVPEVVEVESSKAKIAKLEQRVNTSDMGWEEPNSVDREECLLKLESRVKEMASDEWAF